MKNLKVAVAVLTVCCTQVYAQYPADYPFENELVIPPEIPNAVPNYMFDETDTGGYNWHFGILLTKYGGTLTEADCDQSIGGYCPGINDCMMYLNVVAIGIPPVDPVEIFNCTNIAIFAESDFTGIIAAEKICEPGACCKNIMGKGKFMEDTISTEQSLTNKVESNMCEGSLWEDMYCVFCGGDFVLYCVDYWLHPTERFFMQPCYDNSYRFWLDCKVFAIEFIISYKKEPMHYYSICTNEQMVSSDTFANAQDRVCNPYSYYFPDSVKSTSSGDASATASATDTSSSSADASDASLSHTWMPLMLALVALC